MHPRQQLDERSAAEVDQVHAHLRATAAVEEQAERAYARQAAGSLAHGARDRPRGGHVGGGEPGVDGEQEEAGADDGHPQRGVDAGGSEVGRPLGLGDLRREALELPAADVGEQPALRRARRLRVEVDGEVEALRHRCRRTLGGDHRVGHGGARQRHEGHHVDSADPWVDALVAAQVDALGRP